MNKPASQDAYIYATVEVASIELQLGHYEGARKKLDECERILDSFNLVETVVHASFYCTNADYYKVRRRAVLGSPTMAKPISSLGQTRVRLLLQKCPPFPRLHRRR